VRPNGVAERASRVMDFFAVGERAGEAVMFGVGEWPEKVGVI